MKNDAWQTLANSIFQNSENKQVEVFLFENHPFSVVNGRTGASLKIYLVEGPHGFLELLKSIAPQDMQDRCLTDSDDLYRFKLELAELTPSTHTWLVQNNIPSFLNLLHHAQTAILECSIQVYLILQGARKILDHFHLIPTPVRDCTFWTWLRSTFEGSQPTRWERFLQKRSLEPEELCYMTISLGLTSDLPAAFASIHTLMERESSLLFKKEFWSNRRRARMVLQEWGLKSGQEHPMYIECLAYEDSLINSKCSSRLKTSHNDVLNEQFKTAIMDHLLFPMLHSSVCETPKLLIYHTGTRSIGVPILSSDWVVDYIVGQTSQMESILTCELHLADVMGKYVGESEQNLKDSLELAERLIVNHAWVILIIHDLELLHRDDDEGGVERNLITNLLIHLDGIRKLHRKLVIIGVSKKNIKCLDPAMIRPGRLSTLIPVYFTFA